MLLFDKPVVLTLPGVTGPVGYKPAGSNTWVMITQQAGGTYNNPTAPLFPGEAYITNGTDTKIITWHFTSFAGLVARSTSSGDGDVTPVFSITTANLSAAIVGQQYSQTIGANDVGTAPYTFSVTGGALPEGLALSSGTGAISGTPATAGKYSFTITVKDANGRIASRTFEITVNVLAVIPPASPAVTLKDISGHWARSNIEKLVSLGAINGYPDGNFKPDNTITRAEFVVVLVKAFKLEARGDKVFADTEKHWARDAVSIGASNGILGGYSENTFGPDDPVTREQMAVMTVKAAGLSQASGELAFTDSGKISTWAKDAVLTAVKDGIINGYPDNSFRPEGNATRAEAVTVIVNALNK